MSNSVQPQRRQPARLPCPWDSPGKNTGVDCHFLLQCMTVKLLSLVWLLATPWTAAHQAPPSMGFSRQEYWSGVPLPFLILAQVVVDIMFIWVKYSKRTVSRSIYNNISFLSKMLYGLYSFVDIKSMTLEVGLISILRWTKQVSEKRNSFLFLIIKVASWKDKYSFL